MSFKIFPLHATDSYKLGHIFQYPKGTTKVYSNTTPRTDARFDAPLQYHDHKMVVWNIQGTLLDMKELFDEEFFSAPKDRVLRRYARRIGPFVGANEINIDHMEALHDLGYLPIRVKALLEGSRVNMRIPVFTITNTHPDFFWLPNYLETWLQSETWKGMTVATIAYTFRRMLEDFAEQTGVSKDFVLYQGHNFADRGMSGLHDAARTLSGHQLSFYGTDSLLSNDWLDYAYRGEESYLGGSVPATEHAVTTAHGPEGEKEFLERLFTKVYPTGIVSAVADSYDFWEVISKVTLELKEAIMNRKPDALGFAKAVFRPDSGDPVKVMCGDAEQVDYTITEQIKAPSFGVGLGPKLVRDSTGKFWKGTLPDEKTESRYENVVPLPQNKGAVECLWDNFGGTVTEKGYQTNDNHVGLIYGDGMNFVRVYGIQSGLMAKNFSSANTVFGIGSYTYNCLSRDIFGLAMKATYIEVDDIGRNIFKAPKTDDGSKHSAKGLLRVEFVNGNYVLHEEQTWEQEAQGELRLLFEDGKWPNGFQSVAEVRKRLWQETNWL